MSILKALYFGSLVLFLNLAAASDKQQLESNKDCRLANVLQSCLRAHLSNESIGVRDLGEKIVLTAENDRVLQEATTALEISSCFKGHFMGIDQTDNNVAPRKIACWSDALSLLGVQEVGISSVSVPDDADDTDNMILRLPLNSTLNTLVYQAFTQQLLNDLPLLNYVENVLNIIHEVESPNGEKNLEIHYGKLQPFFLLAAAQQESNEASYHKHDLLSRLIGISNGNLSLIPAKKDGQFDLHSIVLESENKTRKPLHIKIYADISASMENTIGQVSKELNALVKALKANIKDNTVISVYTFNESLLPIAERISVSTLNPYFSLSARGMTDLCFVTDACLKATEQEEELVIAYTDGEHTTGTNIAKSTEKLQKAQSESKVNRAYLVRFGAYAGDLFRKLEQYTGGKSCDVSQAAEIFKEIIEKASDITLPHSSITIEITADEQTSLQTFWQQSAYPGLYNTGKKIKYGYNLRQKLKKEWNKFF